MGPAGRHPRLANDWLALAVDLDDGAKVTSLRCRHGREWLDQPRAGLSRSAAGVFGARESWGWDELFPTVLSGAGAPPPWEAPLRDHGELWGRPWASEQGAGVVARYDDPGGRFAFTRALALRGPALRAGYRVVNRTRRPLPFLWAMHPIFALAPGERIVIPGARAVEVTEPDGETVLKLYATPPGPPRVTVEGGCCQLRVRAESSELVAAVGLYLNYGGWPEPGSPLHQVGIEPTTAGVDALEPSAAAFVEPAGERAWAIELELASVEA